MPAIIAFFGTTIGKFILSWVLEKVWGIASTETKDLFAKNKMDEHIHGLLAQYELVIEEARVKALDGLTKDEIDEIRKKKIELENKLIETKLTADKLALQNQINKNTLAASLKENKTNKKRVIVWSVFSVLFLLCAAVAIIIAVKKQHGEKDAKTDKYLMISRFLKRANNPTLSYLVASDWFKKNSDSDSMHKYLKEFDTSNYIYLSGIYPSITGIVAANIDKANRLVITEAENLSVWDLKNGIMIDRKKTEDRKSVV